MKEKLTTGELFEDELLLTARRYFGGKNIAGTYEETDGTEADWKQGTDCKIWGLPVDFTYNFAGKDHMVACEQTVDLLCGVKVRYGVRTGNNHGAEFDTPVLVVGFECDSAWLHAMWENIFDDIRKNFMDIIDAGIDQYWETVDAMA